MTKPICIAAWVLTLTASIALAESNTPPPEIGNDANFIAAKKAIEAKAAEVAGGADKIKSEIEVAGQN